jgi:AcrR family transcriptional regulator
VSTSTQEQADRPRLSRDRVIAAGVTLADESGIAALSMRKLGERLGVEAMSLYKHVGNKDDLLDGMVDAVFAELELPSDQSDWRAAMRHRAMSVRAALQRHPWAVPMMQSRSNPGPHTLSHLDAVIGLLRDAGFSVVLTAHALSVIDAYVYGFAMQEKALPFDTEERSTELIEQILAAMPVDRWPHLVEFSREHVLKPGYDYSKEFDWGLDVVLDGLHRARSRPTTP